MFTVTGEIPPGELTALLQQVGANQDAWAHLIPLVYAELHTIAASYLRREGGTATLQPTSLIHETYLRLLKQKSMDWRDRHHFFGVAAHLMRLIVVDHARRLRLRERCEPGAGRALSHDLHFYDAVDQALEKLAGIDERQVRIVELRFFAGLNVEETAQVLKISPKTVKRDWSVARAWLHGELKDIDGR